MASTKYPKGQVPSGKEQNVVAVVMGRAFPGVGLAPPYVSVTFAEGKDSTLYDDLVRLCRFIENLLSTELSITLV